MDNQEDILIDALPNKEPRDYTAVVLFRPWDQRVVELKDGVAARALFRRVFPQFEPLISK